MTFLPLYVNQKPLLLGYINDRYLDGENSSLSFFTVYFDRTSVQKDRISCNRKSQTGSADLSGMRFIHTVKSFKNSRKKIGELR